MQQSSREALFQTSQGLILSDLLPFLRDLGWILLVFFGKSLIEPCQDIPANKRLVSVFKKNVMLIKSLASSVLEPS